MKSFRFNREDETLTELENNSQVPIYKTVEEAEADLEDREVGDIVAIPDSYAGSADAEIERIQEAAEDILKNAAAVPLGAITELPDNDRYPGYLKCDGSEFDEDEYPLLYALLQDNHTPLKLVKHDPLLSQEVMTGEFFDGKPIYAYRFMDNVTRASGTWYTIAIDGDLNFPATKNIDRIIRAENQTSHDTDDFNGTVDSCIFEIRNQGSATAQFSFYCNWQSYYVAGRDRFITLYYTKTEDDWDLAEYKWIRSIAGLESEEDSEVVVSTIRELKDKIAYNSLPVGNVVSMYNEVAPYGYLKCDGSTFDENEYPILYNYLGTNVLPDIRDDDETELWNGSVGVYNANFSFSESLLNFDKVLIYTGRLPNTKRENWGCQVFDRETIARMASFGTASGDAAYWGGPNYSTTYTRYKLTEDGMTFVYYNGGSSDSAIYKVVGVGKKHKFIKAVTGIEEGTDEQIVQAINDARDAAITAMTEATADLMNIPVGTIVKYAGEELPEGYLWCDGEQFERDSYPALYMKLHDDHTPRKFDREVELFHYDGIMKGAQSVTLPLSDSMWNYEWLRFDAVDMDDYAKPSGWVKVSDIREFFDNNKTYNVMFTSYSTCYQLYKCTEDGMQLTYGAANSDCAIKRVVGYKASESIIKASSGIMDGTPESESVVTALHELGDKVAYNGLPVGSVITLHSNEFTPAGYLKCDGLEFDTEQYPLLAEVLHDSKTPEVYSTEETVLWDRTVAGTATDTTHVLSESMFNFSQIRIEGSNSGTSSPFVCASTHLTREMAQAAISASGTNNDIFLSWYSDNHRYYYVNSDGTTLTGRGGTGTWEGIYRIVGIGRFNKYIKAVSGIEDNSTEAVEVADAISIANNSLQTSFENYKTELTEQADTLKQEIMAANQNSWSETPTWTGGYWIDGKKIYREVFTLTAAIASETWGWGGYPEDRRSNIYRFIRIDYITANGSLRFARASPTTGQNGFYFPTAAAIGDLVLIEYTVNDESLMEE